MSEEDKCSRCGKDIGGVILFDSSSTTNGMFCLECHNEDMREYYREKQKNA